MILQYNNAGQCSRLLKLSAAFGLAAILLGGAEARATNFTGNGNTGFGGAIGDGTLTLTDDGTNIYGSINLGNSQTSLNGNGLVIYVDNGAGNGFTNTAGFNDQSDQNHIIIAGVDNGQGRSVMTFMTGFSPQYAISLIPGVYGGIWKLANGNNGSFNYIDSANLNSGALPYTFSFPASDLGLATGVNATIKLFGSFISTSAYRSTEANPGNDSGASQGWYPFTQTAFASYTFDAGAPTLTPVTFQVDMTEQMADGSFNPPPGGSDVVYAAGTFQTNAWSGFPLTNNPAAANPNIFSGTYLDENPTNTAEQYKFNINQENWEGSDNRLFTLQPGPQTEPLVYFTDLWPSPSATTNSVTFQIDMTSAIALGTFTPGSGSIEVFGTFESPAPQWVAGFILTNNPGSSNVNIYSGTTNDGNYPGTWEQYKYVIVSSGDTYESINNRDFTTPTNSGTLPLAYFNNINNTITVPITFQVDMTSQVEAGLVDPGAGETVGVSGSFQNPAYSGATLTNNPDASNTNIFSGTFQITGEPGYVYQYKFILDDNGTFDYESPSSTGGQNRVFTMPSSALTLPLVFWSDQDPNNDLPEATEVTFTVNMTNAVDENGVAFNPSTDAVFINGTLPTTGGQFSSSLWTDPTVLEDFPANELSENGFSSFYSATFLFPAGSPLQVTYKYGIFHNVGVVNAGPSLDNEAGFADNHSRYIRELGTYAMPVDIFGQQVTNEAAANEISFGDLAIGASSQGNIALTWLGRPGVYLQSSTNLASGVWVTATNSGGGISATNLPASGNSEFFRLVNP